MSASVESGLAVAQPDADPDVDLARVAREVLDHGAARCEVIDTVRVVVRDDPMAHADDCRCAPGNLMDPPFAPTPAEFRPWLQGFTKALALQVDRPAAGFRQGEEGWACRLKSLRDGGEDKALHAAWRDLHDAVMWSERELFRLGYYLSVGFGALTCILCQTCDVSGLCKFPYRARPSIEAVGVDVDATLRELGMEPQDGSVLTALVLAV